MLLIAMYISSLHQELPVGGDCSRPIAYNTGPGKIMGVILAFHSLEATLQCKK